MEAALSSEVQDGSAADSPIPPDTNADSLPVTEATFSAYLGTRILPQLKKLLVANPDHVQSMPTELLVRASILLHDQAVDDGLP